MIIGEPPKFLDGMFQWKRYGYHYPESPSESLLEPSTLNSPNPWLVLAAALEHAKRGNFDPLVNLEQLLTMDDEPLLLRACMELLGNVGTEKAISVLKRALDQGPDWLQEEACGAMLRTGYLWMAPLILNAWSRVSRVDYRESIGNMLFRLLSNEKRQLPNWEKLDVQEYRRVVIARVEEIKKEYGNDSIPLWRGEQFGVLSMTRKVQEILLSGTKTNFQLSVLFIDFRQRFESSTGIDCSPFFKDKHFQPLYAGAIIEKFLEGSASVNFDEGTRYFFGHKIIN